MNTNLASIIIGIVAIAGIGFFAFSRETSGRSGISDSGDPSQKNYKIVNKWELPKILEEVSGIEWLDDNRIACVQDEDGILFIFNLSTSEIENRIRFSGDGDYEGLTILRDTAYVLRSDGAVFRISSYLGPNPGVEQYHSFLTETKGIDVEGLCADEKNNRLLIALKEEQQENKSFKGIYAFDLETKEIAQNPVFQIQMSHAVFENIEATPERKFSPSEIEIHPGTGELYILDGRRPKLLITDPEAGPEDLYIFNKEEFSQPEGITFHPDGSLYISNEAGEGPANILQVSLGRDHDQE